MPKFVYDKLIRDKISPLASQDGAILDYEIVSGEAKRNALIKKLGEEIAEVYGAKDKTSLLEELVDIQSVIDELLQTMNISPSEFAEAKEKKLEAKGRFEKGIYAHTMTVNPDHPRYQYFRDNPEKYPEISE